MLNEFNFYNVVSPTINANIVTLEIYSYDIDRVDLSSFKLVTSNQEEVIINESDWIDDLSGKYYCTIELQSVFDYVDVYAQISLPSDTMTQFPDYVGSLEKEHIERIYT